MIRSARGHPRLASCSATFGLWLRSLPLQLCCASAFIGIAAAGAFRFAFQPYDFVWTTTVPSADAVAALIAALRE